MFRLQRRTRTGGTTSTAQGQTAPGRSTLTAKVQRRAVQSKPTEDVAAAADKGVDTPAAAMPHGDAIQESFGPEHDVSGVKAHAGGEAEEACDEMGAEAYATGNDVVFGEESPSLHTAAHEAAHVVQQAEGVSLKGGVGEDGDAFEQHADAVADRVVAGESAADLLSSGPTGGGAEAVQRKPAATDGCVVQMQIAAPSSLPRDGGSKITSLIGQYNTAYLAADAETTRINAVDPRSTKKKKVRETLGYKADHELPLLDGLANLLGKLAAACVACEKTTKAGVPAAQQVRASMTGEIAGILSLGGGRRQMATHMPSVVMKLDKLQNVANAKIGTSGGGVGDIASDVAGPESWLTIFGV